LNGDGVSSFLQAVPNFLNRNNGNYPVVFPKRKTYALTSFRYYY